MIIGIINTVNKCINDKHKRKINQQKLEIAKHNDNKIREIYFENIELKEQIKKLEEENIKLKIKLGE